ncbi:putative membrane protein YqiK [Nocardia transvalensis]|uniref:Putative membrane protein YqiK n=1 Tax=Nocardia transvalensis TaxID=37333 RepID=A0A7W9PHZ9_9NOCA|nr:hypothetical protein [Nocardia transvalensis]MBB5916522.1 putative membrane protein YqiK [Nocardia transvalensis]
MRHEDERQSATPPPGVPAAPREGPAKASDAVARPPALRSIAPADRARVAETARRAAAARANAESALARAQAAREFAEAAYDRINACREAVERARTARGDGDHVGLTPATP